MIHVTAVAEIASKIEREWGECYSIAKLTDGPILGSGVAEVWAGDGSVFYVGALSYGERWAYAEDEAECRDKLRAVPAPVDLGDQYTGPCYPEYDD